jgi:hypothetical protein
MTRRILIGLALLVIPGALPAALAAVPAVSDLPVSLQTVPRACSLRKVAEALSREFKATVGVDASLADLRVAWAYQASEPIETILTRLAELTDGRVTASTGASGRRRFTLERPVTSRNLEAWWRRESLLRTLRDLLRAADQNDQGKLETDSFSPGVQTYLRLGRASELKYLRLLNQPGLDRLLAGEKVTFPPGAVPNDEIYSILARVFPPHEDDLSAEESHGIVVRGVEATQKNGIGLQIDFNRKFSRFHLLLQFGGNAAVVLTQLGADEVGLPATRTNPYRLLEAGAGKVLPPALPEAFSRPLTEDLAVRGGRWESVLPELARVTGLDVTSDGYLCRYPSALHLEPGKRTVLASRGLTVAEALDQVCRQFSYLWWQKDGRVYLRARSWPWDTQFEVPDRFLDRWTDTLARGRSIGAPEIAALAALTPFQRDGLSDLSGSPFLSNTNLQQPMAQEFLRLFPLCTLAQQERALGPGLVIAAATAAGGQASPPPTPSPADNSPVLWRLEQKVTPNPKAMPPTVKVELALTREQKMDSSTPPQTSMVPLTIELPMPEAGTPSPGVGK